MSVMQALTLQQNLNIFSQNCMQLSSHVKLPAALNKSMGKRHYSGNGWVYSQLGTKKRRKEVLGKMKQTWERQGKSDLR